MALKEFFDDSLLHMTQIQNKQWTVMLCIWDNKALHCRPLRETEARIDLEHGELILPDQHYKWGDANFRQAHVCSLVLQAS